MTPDQKLLLAGAARAATTGDLDLLTEVIHLGAAGEAVAAAQATYDALRSRLVERIGWSDTPGDAVGVAGDGSPLVLRVGMTYAELGGLDLGTCEGPNGCECSVCLGWEELRCRCGHPFIGHHDVHEIGPGGCTECDTCTGFCLASWLGGPALQPIAEPVPGPPAP